MELKDFYEFIRKTKFEGEDFEKLGELLEKTGDERRNLLGAVGMGKLLASVDGLVV